MLDLITSDLSISETQIQIQTQTQTQTQTQMRIAVIVATRNRAEEVGQLLQSLESQTLAPCAIILSVESDRDLPSHIPANVTVIKGAAGLTKQRNRGLEAALPISDVVVFFDDDFLPAKTALEGMSQLFLTQPKIVSATGSVLSDGVKQGGITYLEALEIVHQYEGRAQHPVATREILWAYGCNMAFRAVAVGALRFDENLPLHGWQEDMDFVARILACGKVVQTTAFAGVHRGVNKGRSPGMSLGFAQVVNPVYLVRKGAMSYRKALNLIAKNFLANHIKAFHPEPFIDRRGRVLGNWRGIAHIVTGRADPMAILLFR